MSKVLPLEQKAREPSMQAAWPWAQADWPVRVEKRVLRSLAWATFSANSVGVTVEVGEGMSVTMVGTWATGLERAADDAGLEMGPLRASVGEVRMAVGDVRAELEEGDEVVGEARVELEERDEDSEMLSVAVDSEGFVVTLNSSPGTKVTTVVVVGVLSRSLLLLLLGSVPFRLAR
jgi:hypothetical protein